MLDGGLFDSLDKVARIVRKRPEEAFGGIQLLLCGDFFQVRVQKSRIGFFFFKSPSTPALALLLTNCTHSVFINSVAARWPKYQIRL